METDCHHHSRTCHKCQIYANKVHVPPVPLNVLTSPWSFAMWDINMIGEIKPTSSNGHRFILVAIDYFTKWVEAALFASVTKNIVARFIKYKFICRYGIVVPQNFPSHISQYISSEVLKLLKEV